MTRRWMLALLLLLPAAVRAGDWPVPRGPSREPAPYRYDAKLLKDVPKAYLDEAAACVLYSGTTHLIEPDGTSETISHEITRLNARKGIEKLGEYRSISYNPAHEKLTLNLARVLKADGSFVDIEPRHVHLRDASTDFLVYDPEKQLVISFPNLQVGDAYEVRWTVRGKHPEFGGEFFTRYTFGDDSLPIVRDELRIRVPKNKTLHHATINGTIDLDVSESDGQKFYRWSVTNRDRLPQDDEKPLKEELRLQVACSTFPSWQAVGLWKQKLRADCWKCTAELRTTIDDITRGMTTQTDKARALTHWVRKHIRYLSRGPGGAGYTPHLPHQVLGNRFGDCKDQAQLLAVMLREIGVPVWLVTLGTLDDGQVLQEVPSPWGTHAILHAQIDGRDVWIDTTISLAAWDFLPRTDRDRLAYLTRDADIKLVRTPPFTASDFRVEQTTKMAILSDGTSRSQRVASHFAGSAWARRENWLEVPAGERRKTFVSELQDANAKTKLLDLKFDDKNLRDLDQPAKASLDFEIPGHFAGDPLLEGSITDSPVWNRFLGYTLDADRELAFVLGTPFESVHRYEIELPLTHRLDRVPEDRSHDSAWGFYRRTVRVDPTNPRKLAVVSHMRLDKIRVEKADFAAFQAFHDNVTKSYRVWLALRPISDLADVALLEKSLDAKTVDAATVKTLAKLYQAKERGADARRVLAAVSPRFVDDKDLWELRVQAAADSAEREQLYRQMLDRFPGEPNWQIQLAVVCASRNEHAEANKLLVALTSSDTASVRAQAHYQLAQIAATQSRAADGLKHLDAARQSDPAVTGKVDALLFKSKLHENLGQHKEAIQSLRKALDVEPLSKDTLLGLTRLEHQHGSAKNALDHLRRYTAVAGATGADLLAVAEMHHVLSRDDDALDLALRSLERGSTPAAHRLAGLVCFRMGRFIEAEDHLQRGTLDAPADSETLRALIRTHLHLGDLDRAVRRGDEIRKLTKADEPLFRLENDLRTMQRRRDDLLATPQAKGLAKATVPAFVCAEHLLLSGADAKAVAALLNDERFGPASALLGWLDAERGELRKALQRAEAVLKQTPDESWALLTRGRARHEMSHPAALADLQAAVKATQRRNPHALHWLAAALWEAGQHPEATRTQREAVQLQPANTRLRERLAWMEKGTGR